MEVVAATPNSNGVPPFHNHDVREWSRIDSLTGVLERARLETDHWAANTSNSSHKYGKVGLCQLELNNNETSLSNRESYRLLGEGACLEYEDPRPSTFNLLSPVVDSRARSNADGAVQQRARRQLEVFQSSVPGGHLQVIKSHTVSSSRWTSKTSTVGEHKDIAQHFGDLELSLNPLDLSSQKSKATVGRSVGRRPPSRPRARDETSSIGRHTIPLTNIHSAAAVNLHRVSRLCHQIHENAVKQTFGKYLRKPPIHERESGDGVEILEVENVNSSDNEKSKPVNGHASLTRTKSTSSEDLHLLTSEKDKPNKSIEDLEDLEQLQNWRRTSKIRRSLQFPKQNKASATVKPIDLPENTGSVRKIREDLETGRRLSTALRGNNVDLEALDQILQSISTSSSGSDKNSTNGDKYEQPEKETQVSVKKQKRNSFVTVESLQEVRGRLRRTSSPTEDIYQIKSEKNGLVQRGKKDEEADDGIVTEENNSSSKQFDEMPVSDNLTTQSRVRSYVYGMEAMINKKPMLGTGSLESRSSKQFNGASGYRSEDWYNRRKSYGFEQVHNHQEPINSISKNKGLMESSTDSGICRSSEIVLVPTANKSGVQLNKFSDYNSEIDSEKEDKYVFSKNNNKFDSQNGSGVLNVGSVKRYTSIFEHKKENSPVPARKTHDNNNLWNHRTPMDNIQDEGLDRSPRKDFEGTTITIPIVSQNLSDKFNKNNYHQQFNDNRFIEENSWNNTTYNHNGEIKRHSIAVDESKYVTRTPDNKFRRTSLAINDKPNNDQFLQDGLEDDPTSQRKQKKVEFCKTEVHFAAESGRVNIVATDEKPPPTNNFRRRRRNSAALYNQLLNDMNKNGLPVLHFGDSSYEKNLFGVTDQEDDPTHLNEFRPDTNAYYENKQLENDLVTASTVTVSTNQSYQNYQHDIEEEQRENLENEAPKGILKNKPIKPKPYLLGDENFFKNTHSDNEENGIWGVKLKPVHNKSEAPMWRSTVTLKNTLYDRQQEKDYSSFQNGYRDAPFEENKRNQEESTQPEFQKLLRTLRPPRKQEFDEDQRNSDNYDGIRIYPPAVDPRRSSWSVADMIKQVEDVQKSESKGYSTKVNIGGGEATVIEDHTEEENGRHPTWPRRDDTLKDGRKQILNKGLVVRIGRDETKSHTVCSKTTMDNDSTSTTTTTKITIDLSPSPTNDKSHKEPMFQSVRLPRASLHNFKSTSLILNTFKCESQTIATSSFSNPAPTKIVKSNIPQQLEALRKLYEDWQSDSEADKEVQSLMNRADEESVKEFDDDNSSVVSGSWSKMRAFRNMQQQRNKTVKETLHGSEINFKTHARVEKDFSNLRVSQNSQHSELDEFPTSNKRFLNESSRTWEKQQKQSITSKTPHSPVVIRKTYNDPKKQDLRTAYDSDKLSSPFLVGQNVSRNEYESVKPKRTTELSSSLRRRKENHLEERNTKVIQTSSPLRHRERRSPTPTKDVSQNYSPARQKEKRSPSPIKRVSPKYSPTRQKEKRSPSPIKEVFRHYSPSRQKDKHIPTNEENIVHRSSSTGRQKSPNRSVLRNPRKSEMTYFGVKASPSPKPVRKSTESTDQKSWNNKPDLLQHYNTKETVKYRKETKTETKHQKASPDRHPMERPESPIYENIDEVKRYKPKSTKKEFDSSILDELTKAADQILQAVNGYAEDAHKQSDEDKNRRNYKKEKLDTISETKSWKQGSSSKHKSSGQKSEPAKPKLKHTSSTSSVESIAEHRKSMTPVQRTTTDSDRHKKKPNGEATASRAATKARRLQRASSREALLQSHGSSSEDIPISIEVPVRKPRLVRKTKATQLTVTNVVEYSKMPNSASRKREEKGKSEERIPVGALPEIRHKTAVSTIRSTAEKSASRDRSHRSRTEELKKKSSSKKETSRVSSVSKSDRIRSISSKDPINHRISTANIKKCHKSEGSTRQ